MKVKIPISIFIAALFLKMPNVLGQVCTPVSGVVSVNVCSDIFYPSQTCIFGGGYTNNENGTLIVCPNVAGQYVSMTFQSVSFADAGDILRIYSGNNASGPLLATYSYGSASSAVPLISTNLGNGCLTASFVSNSSGVASGWAAILDCSVTPATNDIEAALISSLRSDAFGNHFIDFNLLSPSSFTLSIFSADGKMISEKKYRLAEGKHSIPLSIRELAQGIYFCHVKGDAMDKSFKLIK
jgi:hypothetical protein